jgi:hypothetical protein
LWSKDTTVSVPVSAFLSTVPIAILFSIPIPVIAMVTVPCPIALGIPVAIFVAVTIVAMIAVTITVILVLGHSGRTAVRHHCRLLALMGRAGLREARQSQKKN